MYSKVLPKTKRKLRTKDIELQSTVSDLVVENNFAQISDRFLAAIKKYGANERGEKLILRNWYLELLGAIADFRFGATYVSGISQQGKTLAHTNLVLFCLSELGLNVLWSYDLQASLNIQVPSNFRPVADSWLRQLDVAKQRQSLETLDIREANGGTPKAFAKSDRLRQLEIKQNGRQGRETDGFGVGRPDPNVLINSRQRPRKGARNNTIFQIDNATAQFTYVSTTSTSSNNNGAAAGGIAVGVSRDIIFKEERSQYPIGADAPLARRMDAGRIATKPEREFGTPGGGAGIEAQIEDADYYFYPHAICPNCDREIILNPKGCLLKKVMQDHPILKKKANYLSQTGRPLDWHHHDSERKIATAYFACNYCQSELKNICDRAYFKCLYTGYTLKEVCDRLPQGIPSNRIKAGFNISPLLKESKTNRAAEIIEEGLNTTNPIDWQQQMLGLPSESGENSISLEIIKHAIAGSQFLPSHKPDFKLGGIDCGRGQHWLVKVDFYLPKNHHELNLNQVLESTVRYCYFAQDVTKVGLSELVNDLDFGIIDNEPDRDWSARFCSSTGWQMADQRSGLKDVVTRTKVLDGGVEYPCWLVRNEKFLKQVLTNFILRSPSAIRQRKLEQTLERLAFPKGSRQPPGCAVRSTSNPQSGLLQRLPDSPYPLYRLSSSFARHLGNLKSDRNPLKHIMAMRFDPIASKWIRPDDHVDDIFYALAFSEVAFYLTLMGQYSTSGVAKWI